MSFPDPKGGSTRKKKNVTLEASHGQSKVPVENSASLENLSKGVVNQDSINKFEEYDEESQVFSNKNYD